MSEARARQAAATGRAVPASFFTLQERARRASFRLLLLYAAAIAAIVACAILIVIPAYMATVSFGTFVDALWPFRPGLLYATAPWAAYLGIGAVTLGAIALGSVEVLAHLSLGEAQLAFMLGGRLIAPSSGMEQERRLLNIVEEMSIASGLGVPPVYLLNREEGINAFAAGRSTNQAIIVVTLGALQRLERDELQAVVAHEFAHILNGDILLNLRAAYALQGVVFLSAIGRFMMRYYLTGTDEGRRFVHLPLAAAGAGLFAVGSVGLVFARLIQSTLAREREYLADACALQYTRNGDALCGALSRIAQDDVGGRIRNWHADSLAHMLFASMTPADRPRWAAWFDTHPPVAERIRRASPHAGAEHFLDRAARAMRDERKRALAQAAERRDEAEQATSKAPATIVPARLTSVAALIASIGEPTAEHCAHAAGVLAYLPARLLEALQESEGAQAAVLGLLLDEDPQVAARQAVALESLGGTVIARRAADLAPRLRELGRPYRLTIVALAAPVLRGMDEAASSRFRTLLAAAIDADTRVTIGEFALRNVVDAQLGGNRKRIRTAHGRCADFRKEIGQVLSLLAHAGHAAELEVRQAFERGALATGLEGLALDARTSVSPATLNQALCALSGLDMQERETLLRAAAEAAAADGNVRLMEHELLRMLACMLECPMPPAISALDPRLLRA